MFDFNFDTDLRAMKSDAEQKTSLTNFNLHNKVQWRFCLCSLNSIRQFYFLSRLTQSFYRFVIEVLINLILNVTFGYIYG